MKIKFAILLVAGFSLGSLWAMGQADQPAPAAPPPAVDTQPPEAAPAPDQAPSEPLPAAAEIQAEPPPGVPLEHLPAPEEEKAPLILDLELPAAIELLARMANLNVIIDPSIVFTNAAAGPEARTGPPIVKLRWENVTPKDALAEVLDIYGYTLLMNPKTGIGRVIRKPTLAPLVREVIQLNYSSTTNMIDIIKTAFSDPRSKVTAQPRTSQLIIVTTEQEMDGLTNLIASLDLPTRQVLIEAHLLETAQNPRSVKGIDWSGTLEGQNITFGNGITSGTTTTTTPGAATTTTLPSGRTVTSTSGTSQRTDLTTVLGQGGLSLDTARGFHPSTAFLNADGLRAVLSFLNTDTDAELVAMPRQVTADNQTATLSVTRAFPIFEITPGSAQTPPTAEITYTNLGTILKVTPRINASSNINLKVVPEVSNIDSKDRQIINGDINEANVYAIRRMETEVVIPSGNTLVMGGLISDSTTKSYTKVPILGDLPGIGMAFRRDSKNRSKVNLIVFVTPTIVQDEDFQKATSTFLQTPRPVMNPKQNNAWESGKPYDWKNGGVRD